MMEHEHRRRRTVPMRVAVTSLLVASGISVVGVVPALAAGDSPRPAAFHPDDDRDHGRDHDRWFNTRGDVRYVWFRVCDTDSTATATTTTGIPDTTTETVAPDAIAAAVEGASTETATATDTTTVTDTTTTEPTPATTTAEDEDDGEVYPTFVVVPLPKDEAKALRKLDDRPCFDLTTRAPATSDTTTTATTESTTDAATITETPVETPLDTSTATG